MRKIIDLDDAVIDKLKVMVVNKRSTSVKKLIETIVVNYTNETECSREWQTGHPPVDKSRDLGGVFLSNTVEVVTSDGVESTLKYIEDVNSGSDYWFGNADVIGWRYLI